MQTLEVEVCVIGGGPAGATIARRLALLGHDVCLIERSPFPRRHVGESLSPGILPLFDFIGLRQRIEGASFLRPARAIVRWGGKQRHLDFTPGPLGFQVDRGRFDQLLLDAAKEAGVKVLQPACARRPELVEDNEWQIPVEYEGARLRIGAAYLVDASGRRTALAGRKTRFGKLTIAVYAYWRNVNLKGPETRVEAGEDEWFWGAPLPDRTFNATVFVDPTRYRTAVRTYGLETFYRSLLANSNLLHDCLDGALATKILVCDASTYIVECPVTPRSIKVGEASFTIDPLSSQGVQAAMTSAVHGSIVIHTTLTCPTNTSAALQFYRERQTESSAYHHRVAAQYYSEQHSVSHQQFWQKRASELPRVARPGGYLAPANANSEGKVFGENSRFRLSQSVSLEETPCITGDTIRNVMTVIHPSFERPVAFIKDIEIAPLLRSFNSEETVEEILLRWSPLVSRGDGIEIIHWMCSSGVLVQIKVVVQPRERM